MINFTKPALFIFLGLFLGLAATAQPSDQSRKYRVVAYKNGQPSVTSTSNTTEVVPFMSIYIPNSFTPNGDGMNDTFGATGEAIKEYSIQVYNRWGEVIFQSDNYSQQWDGTYDGAKAPQGTYVYKVSASGITGKSTIKNGTVHLIY